MSGEAQEQLRAPGAVTRLLLAWSRGDAQARDQLMPVVYAELRRRAAAYLRRERRGHTLRPTDLVHEAYLRLCAQNAGFKNREHFGVASSLMRRILVDHARARAAAKRAGGLRVTLGEGLAAQPAAQRTCWSSTKRSTSWPRSTHARSSSWSCAASAG